MSAPGEGPLARLDALPRLRLGLLPTPLVQAPALGRAAGLDGLWLKRDDLLGFGFGGHKVRALELLVAEALAQGPTRWSPAPGRSRTTSGPRPPRPPAPGWSCRPSTGATPPTPRRGTWP